jgi:hypothetical protein
MQFSAAASKACRVDTIALIAWGATIGSSAALLVERIIAVRNHPEDGYRSCLGILRLSTMEKLHAMRLSAMAHAWSQQTSDAEHAALSFDERFGMLIDAEWMTRENKRVQRALKEAKLRLSQASIEGIEYAARRAPTERIRVCSHASPASTAHHR